MKNLQCWIVIGWLVMTASPVVAAENTRSLVMGIHPNISARTILATYQPLREFLTEELGMPVNMYTAPDFQSYVVRTLTGEFDVAVTAPHLARIAQKRGGYTPEFKYAKELTGVVVVKNTSAVTNIEGLRGQIVALPDRLTVISIMGSAYLQRHGIQPDSDITVLDAKSHNNAAIAVDRGTAAAAIIGSAPLAQLPDELRNRLRVIATTESIPSQFILLNSKVEASLASRIKAALIKFSHSQIGKDFLKENGFGGLSTVSEEDWKRLDKYTAEAEKLMNQAP